MRDDELHKAIVDNLTVKTKELRKLVNRINKDIETLSTLAIETNTYFMMTNSLPLHEVVEACGINQKQLLELKKSCKLTQKSPHINRSLLNRFGIIP